MGTTNTKQASFGYLMNGLFFGYLERGTLAGKAKLSLIIFFFIFFFALYFSFIILALLLIILSCLREFHVSRACFLSP